MLHTRHDRGVTPLLRRSFTVCREEPDWSASCRILLKGSGIFPTSSGPRAYSSRYGRRTWVCRSFGRGREGAGRSQRDSCSRSFSWPPLLPVDLMMVGVAPRRPSRQGTGPRTAGTRSATAASFTRPSPIDPYSLLTANRRWRGQPSTRQETWQSVRPAPDLASRSSMHTPPTRNSRSTASMTIRGGQTMGVR